MTPRRCHIAALFCGLALTVALACIVSGPEAIAALAGVGVVAGVLLGEVQG